AAQCPRTVSDRDCAFSLNVRETASQKKICDAPIILTQSYSAVQEDRTERPRISLTPGRSRLNLCATLWSKPCNAESHELMRRLSSRMLLALLAAVSFGRAPVTAAVVASSGDASITHDESAGTWTLAAGGTTLKLALDASRDFSIVSLATASGVAWAGGGPDSLIHLGDQSLPFGNRAAGFKFQNATVDTS